MNAAQEICGRYLRRTWRKCYLSAWSDYSQLQPLSWQSLRLLPFHMFHFLYPFAFICFEIHVHHQLASLWCQLWNKMNMSCACPFSSMCSRSGQFLLNTASLIWILLGYTSTELEVKLDLCIHSPNTSWPCLDFQTVPSHQPPFTTVHEMPNCH